jgi:hypothetical protein
MRWHVECNAEVIGIAIWVPWRPRHRPLIYAFWLRRFSQWEPYPT